MTERPSLLLPLFPLPDTVLFPGMPLPLHIFEPRYRKMVEDALDTHSSIGMIAAQAGLGGGLRGPPSDLPGRLLRGRSTSTSVSRTGGTTSSSGPSRASACVEEHEGEPYRLATVETLADEPGDADALDGLRRQVLTTIARAADGPKSLVLQGELPHDAARQRPQPEPRPAPGREAVAPRLRHSRGTLPAAPRDPRVPHPRDERRRHHLAPLETRPTFRGTCCVQGVSTAT